MRSILSHPKEFENGLKNLNTEAVYESSVGFGK